MFGDFGAPTGQQPLYSGNDVMVGGVAGGDVMKGFSGDDIMLGHGSFTKFIGGLGWDWGSYELATQGVDEDMNRKEFVAVNGAVDNIRDVWQHTEGASGSAFDDRILGDNATRLLVTKDELDNVNLIDGLAGFFDPGPVSFDGGNILLGGQGNDTIIGGGGNDILDGDAWLHVGLTSYSAGGQIIRQILMDPNGNTYQGMQPFELTTDPVTGLVNDFVQGGGHINPHNVDVAVYNGPEANYSWFPGALDGEGFLTITDTTPTVIVGGNPQGLLGTNDGTDRIRHFERLQFTDQTVAIDPFGNIITSSQIHITDPTAIANYEIVYGKYYNAVPFGTPTMTETDPNGNAVTAVGATGLLAVTAGNTLHANVSGISDLDNLMDANGNVIAGATDALTERPLPVAVQRRHHRQLDRLCRRHQPNFRGAEDPGHRRPRRAGEDQLRRRQGLHRAALLGSVGPHAAAAGSHQHGTVPGDAAAVQRRREHHRAGRNAIRLLLPVHLDLQRPPDHARPVDLQRNSGRRLGAIQRSPAVHHG